MKVVATANARAGLFRALDPEESEKFEKQGRIDYREAVVNREPFELNPIHHPQYRRGALLEALQQTSDELAIVKEVAA